MRYLLDTHALLWWADSHERLSPAAFEAIADQDSECWVSVVSAWEMAIKCALGKLALPAPVAEFFPQQLTANRFGQLDIALRHVVGVELLPSHHGDPFDRLLVMQATAEKLTLISADPVFDRYGIRRVW